MERVKMDKKNFSLCMNLHKLLKEKIKGRIFVTFYMGTLTIHINAGKGIKYSRNLNEDLTRYNFEKMADFIEYDYRKFIREIFFN